MIDTHSHIYLEEFDNDREAVVEHARKAGLRHLVLPNVDMHTYDAMVGTRRPQICGGRRGGHRPLLGQHLPQGADEGV